MGTHAPWVQVARCRIGIRPWSRQRPTNTDYRTSIRQFRSTEAIMSCDVISELLKSMLPPFRSVATVTDPLRQMAPR
jgi:hypothetical protein